MMAAGLEWRHCLCWMRLDLLTVFLNNFKLSHHERCVHQGLWRHPREADKTEQTEGEGIPGTRVITLTLIQQDISELY